MSVLFLIAIFLDVVDCDEFTVTAGNITTTVLDQNGAISISSKMTNGVSISFNSIQILNQDGYVITDEKTQRSFNFDHFDYRFTHLAYGSYPSLEVNANVIAFDSNIRIGTRYAGFTSNVYIFEGYKEGMAEGEHVMVKAGDVFVNIGIEAMESEIMGDFVDFSIEMKGKAPAFKSYNSNRNEYKLGDCSTVLFPRQVAYDDNSVANLTAGYPIMSIDSSKEIFTFRFSKFVRKVQYGFFVFSNQLCVEIFAEEVKVNVKRRSGKIKIMKAVRKVSTNCYIEGQGGSYQGTTSDVDGTECRDWTSMVDLADYVIDDNFADGSVEDASNFCRNPTDDGRPWCFIRQSFRSCNVPSCTYVYSSGHFLMEFDKLEEKTMTGAAIKAHQGHSFSNFTSQDFQFTEVTNGKYISTGLDVQQVTIMTTLPNCAMIQIDVCAFKTAGNITTDNEIIAVEKGNIKFSIEVSGWKFCTSSDTGCQNENGMFLDVDIEMKGKSKARLMAQSDNGTKVYTLGSGSVIMPNKVKVDDNTIVNMLDNYPKVTIHDGYDIFTFRFPKFTNKVRYYIIFAMADSGGRSNLPLVYIMIIIIIMCSHLFLL